MRDLWKLLSYQVLIPAALLLGLAPFRSQPRLVEKLGMLVNGTLHRPIDIFDLILHGSPLVLLAVRAGDDLLALARRPPGARD